MVSSISDIGETGHLICQRVILNFSLTPCTKVNSKWIRYLNINFETEKFLEENIGEKFHDIGLGSDLMDMTIKAQEAKDK